MPPSQSQVLRLPGEHAHEHWISDGTGVWKPVAREPNVSGCIVAVEALAMDSAPFWMTASKDRSIDPSERVHLHWEAMGMDPAAAGRNCCHWRAEEESGRLLIATVALAAGVPQDDWIAMLPVAFEPSASIERNTAA